jgi:hypothetical protein
MQQLLHVGDTVSKTYGEGMSQLTIRTDLLRDGISIKVFVGPTYNSGLSRTFLNEDLGSARVFYAHIRDCARAGKAIHQIEAEIAALLEAAVAVDVEAVAEAINADLDAAHAGRVAAYEQEQAKVADIDRTYRRVRITRTHVFTKPLSEPQGAAIRRHRSGIVELGNGVTRPMLVAIADKGYGTLNYVPGLGQRKVIQSLTLNAAGLEVAEGRFAA